MDRRKLFEHTGAFNIWLIMLYDFENGIANYVIFVRLRMPSRSKLARLRSVYGISTSLE